MNGRMEAMTEILGSRQAELLQGLSERLDGLGHRVGQSMSETTRSTHENLSRLNERLAVIDKAQTNITALSGQVVQLQQILANKQTRGAFGQARMEAIVQDGLRARLLRVPGDALERHPAGLPDPPAQRRLRPGRRRQVPAGSLERHPRRQYARGGARRRKRSSAATR